MAKSERLLLILNSTSNYSRHCPDLLGVFSPCYRQGQKEASAIAIKTEPPVKPSQSEEEEERGNNSPYCLFRQSLPV